MLLLALERRSDPVCPFEGRQPFFLVSDPAASGLVSEPQLLLLDREKRGEDGGRANLNNDETRVSSREDGDSGGGQ